MLKKPPATIPAKPTEDTLFHIDRSWWEKENRSFRLEVEKICNELGQSLPPDGDTSELVDWVHPETAAIARVDQLMYHLLSQCAPLESFITPQTTLIEAVFRSLLAEGNLPMTATQVGNRIGKSPKTILTTLAGGRIYKGIKPYSES